MANGSTRPAFAPFVRVLALAGLAFAGGIVAFGDRAATALSTRERQVGAQGGPIVRAMPSPDGRWVAIERRPVAEGSCPQVEIRLVEIETGLARRVSDSGSVLSRIPWSSDGFLRLRSDANDPLVRSIDPRTLECVGSWKEEAAGERDRANLGDRWSHQVTRIRSNGAERCVAWPQRGTESSFEIGIGRPIQTTREPGVVFHVRLESEGSTLLRCDLASSADREIAHMSKQASWTVSPDSQRVAVVERAGLTVYDAHDGRVLTTLPPTRGAFWVEGASRWLVTTESHNIVLHDLEEDRSRPLFEERGGALWIRVLDGDRVLAQQGDRVLLFGKGAAGPRQLFPAAS